MQNQKNIAILLSTYNGERYLSEQLDSILAQSCQDFTLYIRDDGSKDSTMDIVQSYAAKHNNIVIIYSNKNLGCTKSFLTLLLEVESCYYMFCDQDDIWLANKIKDSFMSIKEVETLHPKKSAIVYTDLSAVDGELNVIYPSMWEFRKHQEKLPHSFNYLCHFHDIDGCTMIFNKEAKRQIQKESYEPVPSFMYHDWLLALIVSKSNGLIIPLNKQTMLFRRHGDNETNAIEQTKSILHNFRRIMEYRNMQLERWRYFCRIKKISIFSFFLYKLILVAKRDL